MIEITAYSITLFVALIILSFFYWGAVRPVLITRAKYRLYAIRDELRRLAIDGNVSSGNFGYKYVEEFVNKAIVLFPTVSILTLMFVKRKEMDSATATKIKNFNHESAPELKTLRDRAVNVAAWMAFINSPLVLSVLLGMAIWQLLKRIFLGNALVETPAPARARAEQYAAAQPAPVHGACPAFA